jgi:hypothetical protein
MNFETLAQREAREALASVRELGAPGRLLELKQQARTRRRVSAILAAAAVALVVAAGTWVVTTQTVQSTTPPPVAPPAPETKQRAPETTQSLCGSDVTCLGKNRYKVDLALPVTLTLTPAFHKDFDFEPGDMTHL